MLPSCGYFHTNIRVDVFDRVAQIPDKLSDFTAIILVFDKEHTAIIVLVLEDPLQAALENAHIIQHSLVFYMFW